jgi:hypothetical protein
MFKCFSPSLSLPPNPRYVHINFPSSMQSFSSASSEATVKGGSSGLSEDDGLVGAVRLTVPQAQQIHPPELVAVVQRNVTYRCTGRQLRELAAVAISSRAVHPTGCAAGRAALQFLRRAK